MIYFTGDINMTDSYFDVGFGIGSKLAQGSDPFHAIKRDAADVWVGNFECVTADVTDKKGVAAQQFRVLPKHLEHIQHMDVYGFANNHAMQHGGDAYNQAVGVLEGLGSKVFGTKGARSVIVEHEDCKIAFTGFSLRIDAWGNEPEYWHNPEYWELGKEVRALPKDAYKVVYVHWGTEFINYPSSQQKKFAHWLIDAGFDLVIGMHPHVLQGYEVYNGKYIFYSLGNFVFDMAWEPTHYGAIVKVDFSKEQPVIGYEYVRIGEDYFPCIVNEGEVPERYRFETLNGLITKEENSEEYHSAVNRYYRQYRKANHKDIMNKMMRHPSGAVSVIKDFIKRRF